MRLLTTLLVILLAIPVLAYATGAVIIVPETHSAVVTRFGEVTQAIITGFYAAPGTEGTGEEVVMEADQIQYMKNQYPAKKNVEIKEGAGWYIKVPFVENVHYFESRLLDWDGESKEVATRDLRTLLVDSSVRWRILDPVLFYEAIGPSERFAQDRLDGVIISQIEDMIAETRLIEAVRNQNLKLEERVRERLQAVGEEEVEAAEIRYGRMHLIQTIQEKAGKELRDRFGIQMVDLMITQLNYTEQVRQQVYDRMTAERQRIARRYRAQGERAKREIIGQVNRQQNEILSRAERRREEILGEAEAKRIQILARTHQQNPEFYRFWRSLEAYKTGLDTGVTFVFSNDNPLMEFISSPP